MWHSYLWWNDEIPELPRIGFHTIADFVQILDWMDLLFGCHRSERRECRHLAEFCQHQDTALLSVSVLMVLRAAEWSGALPGPQHLEHPRLQHPQLRVQQGHPPGLQGYHQLCRGQVNYINKILLFTINIQYYCQPYKVSGLRRCWWTLFTGSCVLQQRVEYPDWHPGGDPRRAGGERCPGRARSQGWANGGGLPWQRGERRGCQSAPANVKG